MKTAREYEASLPSFREALARQKSEEDLADLEAFFRLMEEKALRSDLLVRDCPLHAGDIQHLENLGWHVKEEGLFLGKHHYKVSLDPFPLEKKKKPWWRKES